MSFVIKYKCSCQPQALKKNLPHLSQCWTITYCITISFEDKVPNSNPKMFTWDAETPPFFFLINQINENMDHEQYLLSTAVLSSLMLMAVCPSDVWCGVHVCFCAWGCVCVCVSTCVECVETLNNSCGRKKMTWRQGECSFTSISHSVSSSFSRLSIIDEKRGPHSSVSSTQTERIPRARLLENRSRQIIDPIAFQIPQAHWELQSQ